MTFKDNTLYLKEHDALKFKYDQHIYVNIYNN